MKCACCAPINETTPMVSIGKTGMLHDRFDFVRDGFCFDSVDLTPVLSPMRQVDIDQRRIEPLRWFRNAQWNDRLRIKL